jgi:hypothetical protein
MRTVTYKASALISRVLLSVLFAAWMFYAALPRDDRSDMDFNPLAVVLFVVAVCVGINALYKLFTEPPAIQFDDNDILVDGVWSPKTYPWSQVLAIDAEAIRTYAYGIVPVGKAEVTLKIKVAGGWLWNKTIRVRLAPLDIAREDYPAFVGGLMAIHAAIGGPQNGIAPSRLPPSRILPDASGSRSPRRPAIARSPSQAGPRATFGKR